MKWLPALRWKESWWRLPLSRVSAEFLAGLLLDSQTGVGRLADREWAVWEMTRALLTDPALLFYAVLERSSGDLACQAKDIDLGETADWFVSSLVDLLLDGDRQLAAVVPGKFSDDDIQLEAEQSQQLDAYTQLAAQSVDLSGTNWHGLCCGWLEVAGSHVPQEWLATWPTNIDADIELAEGLVGCEVGFGQASLDLRRLALVCQRKCELEDRFATQLHQEKMNSLRQLAYGLTHEINNPLANIRTRAEQLAMDEPREDRRQRLDRIVQQSMRAHEMIADLMYFAHPPRVEPVEVEAEQLAIAALNSVKAVCVERGIQLSIEVPPQAPLISVDPRQILGALQALLRNSIESIGERGMIAIQIRVHQRRLEWIVSDSGSGMSQEARKHAFDPYYCEREAGRGLGLGLSRVYRVAKSHGGGVSIEGGPIGCCIRMWVPR